MAEMLVKDIYKQLKGQIDQLMNDENVDFVTMSKVMHKLVNDFDSVRKSRYP